MNCMFTSLKDEHEYALGIYTRDHTRFQQRFFAHASRGVAAMENWEMRFSAKNIPFRDGKLRLATGFSFQKRTVQPRLRVQRTRSVP